MPAKKTSSTKGLTPKQRQAQTEQHFYGVLKRVNKGETLATALKNEHITRRTFNKYQKDREIGNNALLVKIDKQGHYAVSGRTGATIDWPVLSSTGIESYETFDTKQSKTMGRYWNAVNNSLTYGRNLYLKNLSPRSVYTVDGKRITLNTNIQQIKTWWEQKTFSERETFDDRIYDNAA
jgi:hypothetical protein